MHATDASTKNTKRWSERHPAWATAIGAVLGGLIAIGMSVVFDLGTSRGAVGEGKGGTFFHAVWLYCGTPAVMLIGAVWPHTVGPLITSLRRPQ